MMVRIKGESFRGKKLENAALQTSRVKASDSSEKPTQQKTDTPFRVVGDFRSAEIGCFRLTLGDYFRLTRKGTAFRGCPFIILRNLVVVLSINHVVVGRTA